MFHEHGLAFGLALVLFVSLLVCFDWFEKDAMASSNPHMTWGKWGEKEIDE
jgi:hypothetical protein